MTPQDIATDLSSIQNQGGLNSTGINTMTNFTYTFDRVDDANQFG